jgi:hypothetical protein
MLHITAVINPKANQAGRYLTYMHQIVCLLNKACEYKLMGEGERAQWGLKCHDGILNETEACDYLQQLMGLVRAKDGIKPFEFDDLENAVKQIAEQRQPSSPGLRLGSL